MSFTKRDYQSELNLGDAWMKYASSENEERILEFLEEVQWLPSQVTINRAIASLQLSRTDGLTKEFDCRIPSKAVIEAEEEGAIRLTAAEYKNIPAAEVLCRMRNPRFKEAVYKLVRAGQI